MNFGAGDSLPTPPAPPLPQGQLPLPDFDLQSYVMQNYSVQNCGLQNNGGEYGLGGLGGQGFYSYGNGLFMNGMPGSSSSDNTHLAHSFPLRSRKLIMSDDAGYAALTPSSSGDNSNASPAQSPLPVLDTHADSARRPSNGPRALVPQKSINTSSSGSITTVSSPQNATGPSLNGGGPSRRTYVVPPRPKPGRKPATDEPASKRKAQNRESQRAFRARKAAKVQELQEQVELLEQRHRLEMNEKLAEIDRLHNEILELQESGKRYMAERDYWREQFQQLRDSSTPAPIQQEMHNPYNGQPMPVLYQLGPLADARHDSPTRRSIGSAQAYETPNTTEPLGCDRCEPDNCACMAEIANDMTFQNTLLTPMDAVPLPPRSNGVSPMTGIQRSGQAKSEDEFKDREIDFTAKFQAQRPQPALMPSNEMTKVHDCGWCENNPEYCLCKDPSLRPVGEDGVAPLSRITSNSSMEDVKPASTMTGPGSCADCQANPRQRAWCQRVAQLRSEATPPSSRRNSNASSRRNSNTSSRRDSNKSNIPDVLEPKVDTHIDNNTACSSPVVGERSIGCSEAFKLLDGRVPMDVDHMDWRNLKPVPSSVPHDGRRDTFTMEPGMYSAMELDASSILSTLQHSRRPLEPRPSDGRLAPLVLEAEDMRRATLSPMTGPEDPGRLKSVSTFNMAR
ncbi:Nn.00g081160.m01.CDS01 [Neocucurbitaria sp. VM-36]